MIELITLLKRLFERQFEINKLFPCFVKDLSDGIP